MDKYDPSKIELKWQKIWEEKKIYKIDLYKKPKFYNLVMFPYPSGDKLHIGHWYNFGPADTYARFKKMQGFNVFEPIGFDAFGLPAENYAIKTGIHPEKSTKNNIDYIREQLKQIGAMYDWSREIVTSHLDYYKWTQWLFLQLYKNGLAYRAKAPVNFCPSCQTVLANEQVIGGVCERCDTEVIQKDLEQWFFKITDYAEKLVDNLKKIDWPEESKKRQEDWIGRSEGARIKFSIFNFQFSIDVFTTRPDTIFGVTYLVVAPEKWAKLNKKLIGEVKYYIEQTKKKTYFERQFGKKEKTGVFTGLYAINPANQEKIPIWIADYVLPDYGTGAIMCVPAHDQRDFEFAKKYKLPIKQVVAPFYTVNQGQDAVRPNKPTLRRETAYILLKHWKEDKYLCLDWTKFGWHSGIIGGIEKEEDVVATARREIEEETGYKNVKFIRSLGEVHNYFFAGHKDINRYALGQCLVFQLVNEEQNKIDPEHTKNHISVWVESKKMSEFLNLKVFCYMWEILEGKRESFTEDGIAVNSDFLNELPTLEAKKKTIEWLEKSKLGQGKITYKLRDWLVSRQRYWGTPIPIVYCEKCGTVPVPEKDLPVLLPENVDFKPTGDSPLARSPEFVNVKCPKCGGPAKRETDTLDTFVCSSWYFLRYLSPQLNNKPFDEKLSNQWLPIDMYIGGREHVNMHLIYARFITKVLHDLGYIKFDEPFTKLRHQGVITKDGAKMSKSKGNVVIPDKFIEKYGSDTFRMYLMFMGPYDEGGDWSDYGIVGVWRFLNKVYNLINSNIEYRNSKQIQNSKFKIQKELHKTIKKVTEDVENLRFNTAIAAMMEWMNVASNNKQAVTKEMLEAFIKLLAPFAPHLSEELWAKMGHKGSIFNQKWPRYDAKLIKEEKITIIIQINGKVRDKIEVAAGTSQEEIKKQALAAPKIKQWLEGKKIKQTIYVSGRLINFVL